MDLVGKLRACNSQMLLLNLQRIFYGLGRSSEETSLHCAVLSVSCRLQEVSNFGDGDSGAAKYMRVRDILRRRKAWGSLKIIFGAAPPRDVFPRGRRFSRARVYFARNSNANAKPLYCSLDLLWRKRGRYLIHVLNFAIFVRQYFVRLYLCNFDFENENTGIEFRESVVNIILILEKI